MTRGFKVNIRTSFIATLAACVPAAWALAGGAQPQPPPQPAAPGSVPVHGAGPVQPGTTTPPLATQSVPGQGPQIVFDTPSYDFGKVMAGEQIRHDFWFTNRGNAVLEITAVKPGCGCTVAGDWDRRVEPGKTGKIPALLKTDRMNSAISKNINVTTNVPGQPEIVLWLKGTVWMPIDVQPAYVNFGSITEADKPKVMTVKITNKLDEPIDLKNIKCTNGLFRVETKPITPGKEFEMTVSVLPPMPTGAQSAQITMDTGTPKLPTLMVNATAYIPPRVEIQPQKILIPQPITMDLERAVYVNYNAGNDLKVSDVLVSDPKINLRLLEDARGKRFRIALKFATGYEPAANVPTKITFKTSDKSTPEVTVPIEAIRTARPVAPVAQRPPYRVPIGAANPAGTTRPAQPVPTLPRAQSVGG